MRNYNKFNISLHSILLLQLISCFFSPDKVFSLLSKVSVQFDDQRGPLRPQDLELPDFLKPCSSKGSGVGITSGPSRGEFPLRRTEMHNSDTSLYEPPRSVERQNLERLRKLSNSEEHLDSFGGTSSGSKHYRRSISRAKISGIALPTGSNNNTPVGVRIPYMDMSFSYDGVVPSHLEAEDYFSMTTRSASPDFTDPRLMDKCLHDIGMICDSSRTSSGSNSSGGSKQFKLPATPPQRPLKTIVQEDNSSDCSKPGTPKPAPRHRNRVTVPGPVAARRRNPLAIPSGPRAPPASDGESTCSEVSSVASSVERNSLNSEDLNSTLLPPSASTSDVSGDDQHRSVQYG